MLSALLPGVRELRTPLVTGALWAALVWLVVGPRVVASASTRDFVERFMLADLPSAVWFSAGSIFVYLVGSLLVVRGDPLGPVPRRAVWVLDRRLSIPENLWRLKHLSASEPYSPVDDWLRDEFGSHLSRGRVPVMRGLRFGGCESGTGFDRFYAVPEADQPIRVTMEPEDLVSRIESGFIAGVKREQPSVEVRIQMRFPEVYSEIDRLNAESELRMSIFWPLMALSVLLSYIWSPFALLMVIVPLFLWRYGLERKQEASAKTWSAVVAGEITTPILDAMEKASPEDDGDYRQWAASLP